MFDCALLSMRGYFYNYHDLTFHLCRFTEAVMATPTSDPEPADRPVPVLPPETSGLATAPSEKTVFIFI